MDVWLCLSLSSSVERTYQKGLSIIEVVPVPLGSGQAPLPKPMVVLGGEAVSHEQSTPVAFFLGTEY